MGNEQLAQVRAKIGDALGEDDLGYLLGQMETVRGDAGTSVLERGKHNDTLYLLVEGEMVVTVQAEGRDLELSRVQPGHWFGELSFIEPGESSATVTATTPFSAQTLSGASLEKMIADNPHAASGLIRALTRETAVRLANTSSGVLARVADETYRLSSPEQKQGWWSELLGRVFSRGHS